MTPARAWLVAVLALALAAGCSFSPGGADSCKVRCGPGDVCPEGMTCTPQKLCAGGGRTSCVDSGPPADGPPTMDASMDAPVVIDVAPDGPADLAPDAALCSPATCVEDANPCTTRACQGNMCVTTNVAGPCPTGVCVDGVCRCGAQGQPCCEGSGSPCQGSLQCQGSGANRTCGTCGAVGGPCCAGGGAGACAAGGVCNTTTMMCEACGARGQRCCAGNTCAASLACAAGSCQPCGAAGQPCCTTGRACEVGCCGGAGVAGVCGVDLPADICMRMNFNCGMVTVTDRCNTVRTINCGTGCVCPAVCTNNRCAPLPMCQPVTGACACPQQCCTGLQCSNSRCCIPNGQPCGVGGASRCCSGCCNLLGNCAPGPPC
jgi:hypothetical protein